MITGNELATPTLWNEHNNSGWQNEGGLTIRQQAIKDFMVALIIAKPEQIHNPKEGASVAGEWADAFIAELNKATE